MASSGTPRILTFTPNPCVDKTVFVDAITLGAKHRSQRYTCIPGGKGCNVSRSVRALGGATRAMAVVAGHTGRHVVDMIEGQDQVSCAPLWVEGMTRTITTVLESEPHRQTVFFEPGPQLSPEAVDVLLAEAVAQLKGVALLTLNGAVPCAPMQPFYARLVRAATEREIPVILDAYGPEFAAALEECPLVVKPNVEEAAQFFGHPIDTDDEEWKVLDDFAGRGIAWAVLSLGARGLKARVNGTRYEVVPPTVSEVNAVGSGDALLAGLALGITRGDPPQDCLRLGVAAGTANAMSWDIGHFSRKEVDAIMDQVSVKRF